VVPTLAAEESLPVAPSIPDRVPEVRAGKPVKGTVAEWRTEELRLLVLLAMARVLAAVVERGTYDCARGKADVAEAVDVVDEVLLLLAVPATGAFRLEVAGVGLLDGLSAL
jgi:hypothetical protein